MSGISKRFGSVQALTDVDLGVAAGTIHAVVGENGAGKTTLMKILYGAYQADSGQVGIDGQPVSFRSSAEAIAAGIGMVSQHYGIIPELTCLQNLMLGAEGGPLIDLARARERAQTLAQKMGFHFDWDRDAADLSPAGAQKLEILKLLWRNSRIMILDEPTAMLTPADGEALFGSLSQLAHAGATVILVTHRMPEVFSHCFAVTVLRGGKLIASVPVSQTNPGQLSEWIVGKKLEKLAPHRSAPGEPVLVVENLSVKGYRGDLALKEANLTVSSGEVVGIAGVDGSGQRELFHTLLGTAPIFGGNAKFLGQALDRMSGAERLQAGLRAIPEDRHTEAVIEEWSLEENAGLGLQRVAPFSRRNTIDESGRRSAAVAMAERFNTKHGGLQQSIGSLSGGNQQRFVAARALFGQPKLILAYQPARGLDLAATQEVFEAIRAECDTGAGALVVSYDLDELLEYCDRVVVLNRGELFTPAQGEELDGDAIGRLMVGAG
jgi:general nucleoside transport system ATP-binding protein